jgi:hypothetical protein
MPAARMAISAEAAEYQPARTGALAAIAAFWRDSTRRLFDPYRPELHYMRGPGPKWREKHGEAAELRS